MLDCIRAASGRILYQLFCVVKEKHTQKKKKLHLPKIHRSAWWQTRAILLDCFFNFENSHMLSLAAPKGGAVPPGRPDCGFPEAVKPCKTL